ncbi:MAG: Asp-tRNA(Asn)/Glu-tRNA(Gln) amidotransferase subunit GatA [bacterium]|nr:Asp-tRNA(Asn)/Glu-tRNA(Gln) amidotransferase subunit GatA [bacterium]
MERMRWDALSLGEKIRSGEVSVKEAVDAAYRAIEEKDAKVHAFLTLTREEAYRRAEEVQEGIRKGLYSSRLAGVPIAVKDNICTRGVRTTCASRMLENFVPPYSATAWELLEREGLILIGKTNMDEFAMGSTTETSAFGSTKNPRNLEHVAGGSSGGSCAAVAAGEVLVALGSDTGGSIRQPSSYCGVTGLKPTYGTVSRSGLVAYASSLDQIGPIATSVADCAALLELLAKKDERDSTSMDRSDLAGIGETVREWSKTVGEQEKNLVGVRVGVPKEYVNEHVQPEVRRAVEEAAEALALRGAEVESCSLALSEYVIPTYYLIACAEASSNLERFDGVKYGYRSKEYQGLHEMYKKSRSEGFGEEVKRRIMLGTFVLSSGYYDAYYLKALRAKALIKKEFDQLFSRYDLLLGPAAPTTAPKLGTSLQDPMLMYLSDIDTVAVNLAGLPALTLPWSEDAAGLPVGVQILADCFGEKKIFRAASCLEWDSKRR